MSRFLYLMRHGQSADKQPGQADKERELTPQGVRDGQAIGRYIYDQKINLELILSSTAIRAKHTAELITGATKLSADKIQLEEEVYSASVRTFLDLINEIDDAYNRVMCVGHNPSISYLAAYLTKAETGNMPAAGLVIIQFSVLRWKEVNQDMGELIAFLTPENLKDVN